MVQEQESQPSKSEWCVAYQLQRLVIKFQESKFKTSLDKNNIQVHVHVVTISQRILGMI